MLLIKSLTSFSDYFCETVTDLFLGVSAEYVVYELRAEVECLVPLL